MELGLSLLKMGSKASGLSSLLTTNILTHTTSYRAFHGSLSLPRGQGIYFKIKKEIGLR